MKLRNVFLAASVAALLSACGSSPEEELMEAQAEKTEEETRTMEEYRECVEDAGTDTAKLEACEYLIKALK